MAERFKWSPEVIALRAEISPLVERLLKLTDKEKLDAGVFEEDRDEYTDVQDQYLVHWIVVAEFQPLDGSAEESAVLTETSGVSSTVAVGLTEIGKLSFLG